MKLPSRALCIPALITAVGLLCPLGLHADSQLIVNGGFDGGATSSTFMGSTNTTVPVDWSPNGGYDLYPGYNQVVSGTGGLPGTDAYVKIGNGDSQPPATLSQTVTDLAGDLYSGSIWVSYGGAGAGDAGASFDIWVNGFVHVALDDTAPATWTQYFFSFTGTGSDTITFGGDTNPNEWMVDDVSVTGETPTVTPEPSSLLLLATGLAGIAGAVRRRLAR